MINFDSDYMESCAPEILEKISSINLDKNSGYGTDIYCQSAKEKIRKACGLSEDAEIFFLVGGTQTNATVIKGILRNYEGVVSADTGHVSVHEAGAIETNGHKVLTIPHTNGKINPTVLDNYLNTYHTDGNREHMVYPGMVYISHPTEYGTLYKKNELEQIRNICDKYNIKLYLDGARLGYGLCAENTDVTLKDIAKLCNVFYIGGTKTGAMFGEAVVFSNMKVPHFFTTIKQNGGLLAKGWLLGIQFDTLFTDDLYFKICKNAINQATKIKNILISKGYKIYIDSPTNQQFVIMDNNKLKEFEGKLSYGFWEKYDENNTVIRFATSWATTDEQVKELEKLL